MKPPIPSNEAARLEALRRYRVMDTPKEQAYDDITQLAAFICGTPIALMTLVDTERQWFKSKQGLAGTQTPRDQAFCAHTIFQSRLLVVEDATQDERFATNPLVTADPHIRFYAGTPLLTPDGFGLGSLCVIDRQPRKLSSEQASALESLGRMVIRQLELRRASADLASAAENIKILSGLLPICSYCKGIRNDQGFYQRVETYLAKHSDVTFTHGICPECIKKHFPGLDG